MKTELETLRDVVAGIDALIEPHRVQDVISGRESEIRKIHVRVRDIKAVLDAAEKELRPRGHAIGCGCYWCGKFRRGMAILSDLDVTP